MLLRAEEANLLHAWKLARTHGWWDEVTSAMQGLRTLYAHTGRQMAWARIVQDVTPELTDPATDGPRPGREDDWCLLTDYRVRIAEEARDWLTAQRLQDLLVTWNRMQTATALDADPTALSELQRNQVRGLAASLQVLGRLLLQQQQPRCLDTYKEVLGLVQRIGDRRGEASTALSLAAAYVDLKELRDLDQAGHWCRRSLTLYGDSDRLGQAHAIRLLAFVRYERYLEALAEERPEAQRLMHLRGAEAACQQALALTPEDAIGDLATTYYQLGRVYDDKGELPDALHHYQQAIHTFVAAGNPYGAAQTRFHVALALAERGRLEEAREWARAALRGFQSLGDRAADDIARTHQLISDLQRAIAGDRP